MAPLKAIIAREMIIAITINVQKNPCDDNTNIAVVTAIPEKSIKIKKDTKETTKIAKMFIKNKLTAISILINQLFLNKTQAFFKALDIFFPSITM